MPMSDYLKTKVLEHQRGISTWTPGASSFYALLIGEDFDTAVEVSAGDYARIEVDNDNTEWDVTGSESETLNPIEFTASPANDWTTGTDPEDGIWWIAEYDAITAGNLLNYGKFLVPLYVVTGGPSVQIPAGMLKDKLLG